MQANEWGPGAWKFLHAATFAQEETISAEQQERLKMFFELIGHVLPCGKCQEHYRSYCKDHPVQVGTREELSRWLVDLHNQVNVITNNSFIQEMSYEDVKDVYAYDYNPIPHVEAEAKKPVTTAKSIVLAISVGCLILAIGMVFVLMYSSCRQGRCPLVRR